MLFEQFPEQEKTSTKNLLGIVSRGEFRASREEILAIVMSEHEAKIEGLARHVLAKRTKQERRSWLDEFERKHGLQLTEELKLRILELSKTKRSDG